MKDKIPPEVLQDLQRIAPCTMSRVDAQAGNQAMRDRLIPLVPPGKKVMCFNIPLEFYDAGKLFHLVDEAGQPNVDVTEYVENLPFWRHEMLMAALRVLCG